MVRLSQTSHLCLATAALCFLCTCVFSAEDASTSALRVESASIRVTYVLDSEKITRAHVKATSFDSEALPDGIEASESDSVVAQVWVVNEDDEAVTPSLAMLRIVDESVTPPRDSMWPMSMKRGAALRREISLRSEIRADAALWRTGGPLTLQIVVSDANLGAVVWTATRSLSVDVTSKMKTKAVFDFDVSAVRKVKKEFDTALPPPEREAPLSVVVGFCILTVAPLLALFAVWGRMGALRLRLPVGAMDRVKLVLFQLCLAAHVGVLAIFWVEWNIVTTWKAMAVLMGPTFYFGHQVLSAKATSDYMVEKGGGMTKKHQ